MKIKIIKKAIEDLGQLKVHDDADWLQKSKAAMLLFAKNNSVRNNLSTRQSITRGRFLKLTFKPMPIVIGVMIAALLAGGGTAYASQTSLPGDTLYPVKLMTEDAQTAVAWNSEKKVEMDTKFANRRLEEIKKLQEKLKNKNGEIKLEVVEKAMERAAERLDKAEARIAEMEEGKLKEKALGAASRLEEALQNHEQILSDLAGEVPDEVEEALLRAQAKAALHAERALGTISRLEKRDELKDRIKEKAKEQVGKIMGSEERAEGKLNALENKLEAAENFLENLKERGKDVSGYEEKLGEAKNKLEEAKQLLEEKKFLEAFRAAGQVMKILMQAKAELRPIITSRPMMVPGPAGVEPSSETNELDVESTILPERELNELNELNESSGSGEAEEDRVAPLPAVLPIGE